MHVRAMFRVLSAGHDYTKRPLIKLGPTYANRDGVVAEENKSFSKWTPSGELELTTEEPGGMLEPGAYVYLDMYPTEEAPPLPSGHLRTEWVALRYEVDVGGSQFIARMYPPQGSPMRGSFWLTVTNLDCVPLFELKATDLPRPITVDFSPA